jgi:hypothetical protein
VKDLDLSNTDLDEAVRKSTNILLSKVLSAELSKVVRGKTLTLIQLAQISVNTTHLQSACSYLEAYISKITMSVGDDLHINRLHGASVFKDARTAAEDKIFFVIQQKIDELLDLSEFELASMVLRSDRSETLFELLAYLSSTFASLNAIMPVDVARHAIFSTCKYIADQLTSLVADPELKAVTMVGMQNFALDIDACLEYAENSASLINDVDHLCTSAFGPLRQLTKLFTAWGWEGFLRPTDRMAHFQAVKPTLALHLLERFTSPELKGRKSEEKKMKKQVETITKALRSAFHLESSTKKGSTAAAVAVGSAPPSPAQHHTGNNSANARSLPPTPNSNARLAAPLSSGGEAGGGGGHNQPTPSPAKKRGFSFRRSSKSKESGSGGSGGGNEG